MKRLTAAIFSLALPFMAQAATDLAIAVIDSPDPVQGGATLTYFITARNNGPDEANRVQVSTSIPSSLISVTSSQGNCLPNPGNRSISCEVGTLANGAQATVTLAMVAPDQTILHVADVRSLTEDGNLIPDSNEANNFVTTFTNIIEPPPPLGMCAPEEVFAGGRCCEPGVDEGCSGLPVEPARKQFSCRTSGCVVPIACNLPTQCDVAVNLSVNVNSIKGRAATRRLRFAGAFASVPPFQTLTIRPGLTNRGKRLVRNNRKKLVKAVMTISNTATGELFSRTRVRIRLR
ncbi:MAG: DUF11 domain-containing protein [Actinomycetota bacterium]